MKKRVCIIGGGISGLTAAYLLSKRGIDITLFERSNTFGGNIRSESRDGFLIEHGPNNLLRSTKLVELIDDLRLKEDILPATASAKKRFVLINGRLQAISNSLVSFVFGNYFSLGAKAKILKEPFIRSRSVEGESVAGFFERRFGREVVEKAVDPFIGGIFAGDPSKLCLRSAFPRFFELERDFGSLLVGMLLSKREQTDRSFPRTFTFTGGVQNLIRRLRDRLGGSAISNIGVERIEKKSGSRFRVKTEDGNNRDFDAVVISTKADSAGTLLSGLDVGLGAILKSIFYAPVAVLHSGYRQNLIGHNPEGFGFLTPSYEKRRILGSIWNSSVFPDRAPVGYHLFTTFLGGTRNPGLVDLGDDEISGIIHKELADVLQISGGPDFINITRWKTAIPQYQTGYTEVTKSIELFMTENPGIFFCSNFYRGISVGDCVKNAYRTAEKVEEFLKIGH